MIITENIFSRACDRTELVHQIVGAASMSWENVAAAGIFDDVWARKVAADGLARLFEIEEEDPRIA